MKIQEAIVVEGRYDKNTLSQLVDTLILETAGELQKRAQPASYDFDGSYYQGAHYQAPYLFLWAMI